MADQHGRHSEIMSQFPSRCRRRSRRRRRHHLHHQGTSSSKYLNKILHVLSTLQVLLPWLQYSRGYGGESPTSLSTR